MNDARRLSLAVGLSLLAHASLLAISPRTPLEPSQVQSALQTMTVRLLPPPAPEPEAARAPPPPVAAPPAPRVEAPKPRPQPRPVPPPAVAERAPAPLPPADPSPSVQPESPSPALRSPPPLDMLAMIEQRRAERRAREEAWRTPRPVPEPEPDALTRNLQSLTGRRGVSGVFQVLRLGTLSAEFSFNGWRSGGPVQWREVYEVVAPRGVPIELAVVRRMIRLIRTHYDGDFRWESRRLGRVIVLSARPEDTARLEDFLMREFFDRPAPPPVPG